MNRKNKIIFIIILILGIFLRVYKLYNVPMGIHVDEAGMFVDANTLARFNTDRHGVEYPIYLENFGEGQSIMYAYIVMLLIKIFGSSIYLIRIPSVFFGIMLMIFSYLIAKELNHEKDGLILMLLVAICPYFIQSSRIGLDCNLLLPFLTISLYIYIKAIKAKKNYLFLLAGLSFGFCFYTYALSYIVIPLFIIISTIYLLKQKEIDVKKIILMYIPIIILGLPLVLFILVNYGVLNEFKILNFSICRIPIFRAQELGISNILDNLFGIIVLLSYDFLDYNSLKHFGTIYYICIPLFIYGLIKFNKKNGIEQIIKIMLISCYIATLLIQNININKANYIYFSIIYVVFLGIENLPAKIKRIFIFLIIINMMFFSTFYFKNIKLDKFYFDDELYTISKENYKRIIGENLIIISDNNNPEIYIQMGMIDKVDNVNELTVSDKDSNMCITINKDECKKRKKHEYNRYTLYYND